MIKRTLSSFRDDEDLYSKGSLVSIALHLVRKGKSSNFAQKYRGEEKMRGRVNDLLI